MDREYTMNKLPEKLTQRIQSENTANRFRRRAVLTKGNDRWEIVCCTVEAFLQGEAVPGAVPSRHYRQAILHEDFLTREECLQFARDLQEGHIKLANIDLERDQQNAQWMTELLPIGNDYMERAGCLISLQFRQSGARPSVRTLLAPDEPYYPDEDDATRDWLPLRVYHGHSDARNDHVLFLLPETRAYLSDAAFSDQMTLEIAVAGTEIDSLPLIVKGAYWEGKTLYHVESPVKDGKARLLVPDDADRMEYYLIDHDAAVYDYRREDQFSRQTRGAPGCAERVLQDQVRKACQSGEGLHIEFKPFIELADKRSRKEDAGKRSKQNRKVREVVETVAAFANAEGGHIYLGVNDDCTISGMGEPLKVWAKEKIGDAAVNRYFGTLKNRVKEMLHGEVKLAFLHVVIDRMLVGIVEVSPATHGPVALQQEFHLYVRSGASNRKAPPEQWRSILKDDKPSRLF